MEAAHITIYLCSIDAKKTWFPALQIPRIDIKRLSLPTPLKWLRFVAFTVCGAYGYLSRAQDGPVVDYEITDIGDAHYYNSTGYIQCYVQTPHRPGFHRDVIMRDGCVITDKEVSTCDAAHIIPRRKGDEYITFIVNHRRQLYQDQPFPPEFATEFSINIVENGLLLRKDLHADFAVGAIAFLKTPNFAMQCTDVPRVEEAPMPDTRITMQYIHQPRGHDLLLPRDVVMTGTGESPPPSLLLDFMYGVAAYRFWCTTELRQVFEKQFKDYDNIAPLPRKESPPSDDADDDPESSDSEYVPGGWRKHGRKEMSDEMFEAMDHVLVLPMLLKGRTPQQIVTEREKREKEAEARTREAGRAKVKEWQKMQEAALS